MVREIFAYKMVPVSGEGDLAVKFAYRCPEIINGGSAPGQETQISNIAQLIGDREAIVHYSPPPMEDGDLLRTTYLLVDLTDEEAMAVHNGLVGLLCTEQEN